MSKLFLFPLIVTAMLFVPSFAMSMDFIEPTPPAPINERGHDGSVTIDILGAGQVVNLTDLLPPNAKSCWLGSLNSLSFEFDGRTTAYLSFIYSQGKAVVIRGVTPGTLTLFWEE